MIIKVCGIKSEDNLAALSSLPIDMVGLNFYKPSPRYVGPEVVPQWYDVLPDEVSRVGVFVNESMDDIMDIADEYRLDYVQLHGDEDVGFCNEAAAQLPIIKVVRVGSHIDWSQIERYAEVAEYILFDTDSKAYGGSGHKFDWSLLADYPLSTPYLIGGGNITATMSHGSSTECMTSVTPAVLRYHSIPPAGNAASISGIKLTL